jgi:Mce-associated membrane protein
MPAETDPLIDTVSPLEDEPEPSESSEAIGDTEVSDETEAAQDTEVTGVSATRGRRCSGVRLLAQWVLPVLALLLALAAGFFRWVDGSAQASGTAAAESVRTASESTIAILSYRSDSVDRDLAAASDRLTGGFREQYKQLVGDVVAPGAKQQHITAIAKVPAAASVSADQDHAVVMVFVDQTTTIGDDAPTQTTSSVRVTLDKVRGKWLISQFDPV